MSRRPDPDPERIAYLRRLAKLVDGSPWAAADLVADRYPAETYGNEGSNAKTGLYEALEADADWLRTHDQGTDLQVNTLRVYRATALAWPAEVRTSAAPYVVHEKLRNPKIPAETRRAELDKLIERNRKQTKDPDRPLTYNRFRALKAESKPAKPPEPWDVSFTRKLESLVRSNMLVGVNPGKRPDWWNVSQVGDDTRDAYARILRDLAKRITS